MTVFSLPYLEPGTCCPDCGSSTPCQCNDNCCIFVQQIEWFCTAPGFGVWGPVTTLPPVCFPAISGSCLPYCSDWTATSPCPNPTYQSAQVEIAGPGCNCTGFSYLCSIPPTPLDPPPECCGPLPTDCHVTEGAFCPDDGGAWDLSGLTSDCIPFCDASGYNTGWTGDGNGQSYSACIDNTCDYLTPCAPPVDPGPPATPCLPCAPTLTWDAGCNTPPVEGTNTANLIANSQCQGYSNATGGPCPTPLFVTTINVFPDIGGWHVKIIFEELCSGCTNTYEGIVPVGAFSLGPTYRIQGSWIGAPLVQTNPAECGGCDPADAQVGIWIP